MRGDRRGPRLPWRAILVLLACAVPAGGQGLPSPLAPAHPAPIGYLPPERLAAGRAAPQHVLNVFLPVGEAPAEGWPVVVTTGYGGAGSVPPASTLASLGATRPLWDLVAAGIAVVHYGTPGVGNNRGLWFPPGHPSGRYESFLPAHDNPEKAAVWALQWVKVQTLFPLDRERVALRGSSGGAVLAIRTAMGEDLARGTGSAQVRASTRVAAILAIQPPTSAWALVQSALLTIPFPKHLEQAARPGVACTELSQADPELQKDYSLMRSAFASPEARANNAGQPICLVFGDPVLRVDGAVATFALDATGFPVLHDAILQPTQHDSWFGYVFWRRLTDLSPAAADFHAQHSIFAMRDVHALAAPFDHHTRVYRGGVMGPNATRIGHEWLVARLLSQPLRAAGPRVTLPAGAPERVALTLPECAGRTALLYFGTQERTSTGSTWSPLSELALPHPLGSLLVFPDDSGRFELTLPPGARTTALHLQALDLEHGRLCDGLALAQ